MKKRYNITLDEELQIWFSEHLEKNRETFSGAINKYILNLSSSVAHKSETSTKKEVENMINKKDDILNKSQQIYSDLSRMVVRLQNLSNEILILSHDILINEIKSDQEGRDKVEKILNGTTPKEKVEEIQKEFYLGDYCD